jgi:hypothetical protein
MTLGSPFIIISGVRSGREAHKITGGRAVQLPIVAGVSSGDFCFDLVDFGHRRLRFIQDFSNCTQAPPALGLAAKMAMHLGRRAGRRWSVECSAHFVVAQHIARTYDHGSEAG